MAIFESVDLWPGGNWGRTARRGAGARATGRANFGTNASANDTADSGRTGAASQRGADEVSTACDG